VSDESQGPGWWLASDGKWYPPELAPGSPQNPQSTQPTQPTQPSWSGPPAGASGGGPSLDIGSAFSYGWKKFTENVGQWLLIALIVVVVNLVFAVIALQIDSFIGATIFRLLGFVVGQIVAMGLVRAALLVTAGEAPEVGRVFSTDRLGDYIIGSILYGIIVAIGFVLCLIPGVIAAVMLSFYGFYILDKNMSGPDALKASFDLVRAHAGATVGLLVVAFLVYFVGVLLCGIGVLVSGPVSLVMVGYGYRILNNEPVAP
jgi:hypothetical protein